MESVVEAHVLLCNNIIDDLVVGTKECRWLGIKFEYFQSLELGFIFELGLIKAFALSALRIDSHYFRCSSNSSADACGVFLIPPGE